MTETNRTRWLIALGVLLLCGCSAPENADVANQDYKVPRDGYGRPDLNGVWQAIECIVGESDKAKFI